MSYQIRDKIRVSLTKVIFSEHNGLLSNYQIEPHSALWLSVYATHVQTIIGRRIKFHFISNTSCHNTLNRHKYFDGPILIKQWSLCAGLAERGSSIIDYHHVGGFLVTLMSTQSASQSGFTQFTYQSVELSSIPMLLTTEHRSTTILMDTTVRVGHLYYKQWRVECDRFVRIERHHYTRSENPFTGSEYNRCLNAGWQIIENSTTPGVISTYGPYCLVNDGIPLMGSVRDWYMPKGVHTIVAYAYPEYLTFNLTFELFRNDCEGVTNVCTRSVNEGGYYKC